MKKPQCSGAPSSSRLKRLGEVFQVFLRLGLTSFGGPVAHIGYFHQEFVVRRGWLDPTVFADIVALCQFLPGPASSQIGIAIGILRAGLPGAIMAWIGFTLPSAVVLVLFAQVLAPVGDLGGAGWLHGLKLVAVAIVAQALWAMARRFCAGRQAMALAVGAASLALLWPTPMGQILAIVAGGLAGWRWLPVPDQVAPDHLGGLVARPLSLAALLLFTLLLLGLPAAAALSGWHPLAVFDRFFRSGALVFGGGHVVLPLLQAAVVPSGWVGRDAFLAGYGAAQAVPGPLFTFAAYLGAVMAVAPNGWSGAALCLVAIFLPSFLLVVGVLPWWDLLRRQAVVRAGLAGVNAAVVGLLAAAFYSPVCTGAIGAPADVAVAVAAAALLVVWKVPSWAVVMLGAMAGALL
jgi:chromate transporter